jgi:hypothetical protein
MTLIWSIVSDVWVGVWATAVKAADTKVKTTAKRRTRRAIKTAREIEACLIFTGFEPCGEHKNSFVQ